MLKFLNRFKETKAFTLVEGLIAVFILIVGAGAAFFLITQTLSTASLIRDRFIAAYLAQEGIEIVKNIRDSNWLAYQNWNSGLSPANWQADYNDLNLSPFSGTPLNIENSGFYGYGGGSSTKFIRQINITSAGANRIKVIVTVSWQERGRTYEFKVTNIITNWLNP